MSSLCYHVPLTALTATKIGMSSPCPLPCSCSEDGGSEGQVDAPSVWTGEVLPPEL